MLQRQLLLAPKGQSLLEIVVLIGLALVIITGLTIVTVNGLKNTQFSQNKAQATRLAQDGLDKIRTMRDQNCPINIGGTNYFWYNNATLIWSRALPATNPSFAFNNPATPVNCGPAQPAGTGLFQQATATSPDTSLPASLQTTFTRIITIHDFTSSHQKTITVTVNWTDISGTHQSDLSTILGED